jgi:hypothetical protein
VEVCALFDLLKLLNCVVMLMGGRRCATDCGDIMPLYSDAQTWVSMFFAFSRGLSRDWALADVCQKYLIPQCLVMAFDSQHHHGVKRSKCGEKQNDYGVVFIQKESFSSVSCPWSNV